jgi:PAS domain S-box-containing protein
VDESRSEHESGPRELVDGGLRVATHSVTTQRRTEHRRARSLIELGLVVLLSVGFYAVSARLNLFDWLDKGLDLHGRLQADEVFLALPVALMLLAVYSWRRYQEAQAETAAAVAAEQDLARTTEEFRSLFDYHPHAVFSVDPHRRYRRLNPAAEALSGYTEEEMAPRLFPWLKSRDMDRVLDAFERAMKREPQRLHASMDRKDGERRQVDVTMVPIVVNDEPVGVYVVTADVTDDRRMRRALAQALADAEQASAAKTLLVANVSHELRTPLAGVIGAAEILADSDLDGNHQRLVAMISRNGDTLLRLVNDLLDLTRMEAGQLTVESVPFDLRTVLDQTLTQASSTADKKGLTLRIEVDPVPGKVIGDPTRLGQVLANLLANAVKFTDEGEVGLALSWHRDGETLETVFRVWDTGIGIDPEDQERLFEHFEQADPSSTRKHGGVGLGLAISRQLTQLMGGELSVESHRGVGSTFTVRLRLPLVQ